MTAPTIRLATRDDLVAINDIYNHSVLRSTATYQEQPETLDDRHAWFASHDGKHPVTVAELDSEVVGWGALSPFHKRAAYRHTVEDSVYVAQHHLRRGIGRMLLADLIGRGRAAGHHTIVALIDAEQSASVALHAAAGFKDAGLLRDVGFKFDRWLHVRLMQFML